jgi:YidC/Oxa1 family membrane protein insertase
MERRVLIAVFLCFLVIYVWQALFVKPVPKPATEGATSSATSSAASPAASGSPAAATPLPSVQRNLPVSPGALALVSEGNERDIRIETDDIIATFTNRGARLRSWRLKKYRDQQKEPLELVATELSATHPLPFSLRVPDEGVTATLNGALYAVTETPADASNAPVDVKFEYRDSAGIHSVKQFHLDQASYFVSFRATVTSSDRPLAPEIEWGPGPGDVEVATRSAVPSRGLLSAGGKEQRLTAANIAKQASYEEDFKYAGVDDHYFMVVAYEPHKIKVAYQPVSIPPPAGSKDPARTLMAFEIDPVGRADAFRFYVGPKDFNGLSAIDPDFVRAIDFGIFSVIIVPLLRSLNWINGWVHNYGWSIVILTIIVNLIIFPLRHKSVVSMRKLQEIQPEAKAIQARYAKLKATDPAKQKMNQELMELYKQRGVNPAGGCIPMLLPFPILIAFYYLLSTAIELRGAPFMLWIHDLSGPDPYYVLPILMGASQLWQQWIMPAAGVDPMQRKMMMIMPAVFVFLFINYPSGAALYWLSSTAWGIGQQYFTNYWIGPPVVRTVRPPAERRAKRVGSGKTDAAAKGEQ